MFSGLSNTLVNLSFTINSLNEDLSSGIRKVLSNTDALGMNFLSPIDMKSNLAKTLKQMLSQTNTQFLIPVRMSTNFGKSMKEFMGTGGEDSKLLVSEVVKLREEFQDFGNRMVEAIQEVSLGSDFEGGRKGKHKGRHGGRYGGFEEEGIWSGLEAGSLSMMVRGLVQDIKDYKAIAMLATITTAAWMREMGMMELRTFTENLGLGTKSLEDFETTVAVVSVNLGENFANVSKAAADIHKDMNLAFTSESFSSYLLLQGKIVKATGMSTDTLNHLFKAIKIGSTTESDFIKTSENMGNTLIALAGKAGMTKTALDDYAKSLTSIHHGLTNYGASAKQAAIAQTQLGRWQEDFATKGLPEVGNKIMEMLAKAHRNDPDALDFFGRLGVIREDLAKAFESGNFESIIKQFNESLRYWTGPAVSLEGRYSILEGLFPPEILDRIISIRKEGNLTFDTLYKKLYMKFGPDRLDEIMKSLKTSLEKVKEFFANLVVSIGKAPLKVLTDVFALIASQVEKLNTWYFKGLSESTRTIISGIISSTLSLAGLAGAIGLVITAAKGLALVFSIKTLASGIMGLFSMGWVGVAIAGIVAIGAASLAVYTYWDEIKDALNSVSPELDKILSNILWIIPPMKIMYDLMKGWVSTASETGTIFEGPLRALKIQWFEVVISIREGIEKIEKWWNDVTWTDVTDTILAAWRKVCETIIGGVKKIWEWIKTIGNFSMFGENPVAPEFEAGVVTDSMMGTQSVNLPKELAKEKGLQAAAIKGARALKQEETMKKYGPVISGGTTEGIFYSPGAAANPKELGRVLQEYKNWNRVIDDQRAANSISEIVEKGYSKLWVEHMKRTKGMEGKTDQESLKNFFERGFDIVQQGLRQGSSVDEVRKRLEGMREPVAAVPVGPKIEIPTSPMNSPIGPGSSLEQQETNKHLVKICMVLGDILDETKDGNETPSGGYGSITDRQATSGFENMAYGTNWWGATV